MKTGLIPAKTLQRLNGLFSRFPRKSDALLTALYIVQEDCDNSLSTAVLDELAAIMEMPKSIMYEVVTFYHLYSTEPRAGNVILICQNLCCYLRGSDEIYQQVLAMNKPVVASMGELAASGGYYVSAPATEIWANPGTLTGSIGVISQFIHIDGLLEEYGVEVTTIKSGEFKDIGSLFRSKATRNKRPGRRSLMRFNDCRY